MVAPVINRIVIMVPGLDVSPRLIHDMKNKGKKLISVTLCPRDTSKGPVAKLPRIAPP